MKARVMIVMALFLVIMLSVGTVNAGEVEDVQFILMGSYLSTPESSGTLAEIGAEVIPEFYVFGGVNTSGLHQGGFDFYPLERHWGQEEELIVKPALGAHMIKDGYGTAHGGVTFVTPEDNLRITMRGALNYGQISFGIQF